MLSNLNRVTLSQIWIGGVNLNPASFFNPKVAFIVAAMSIATETVLPARNQTTASASIYLADSVRT